MNNTKKHKKQTSWVQVLRKWWIVILFVLYFVATVGHGTFQIYQLKREGICAKAKVYNRYHGYRAIISTYQFIWNNHYYTGTSTSNEDVKYIRKEIIKDDSNLLSGDTITIVFWKQIQKSIKVIVQ
jgi:hypothetical protein